eukprot:525588-Prorocentrum_minimum.AAC.2
MRAEGAVHDDLKVDVLDFRIKNWGRAEGGARRPEGGRAGLPHQELGRVHAAGAVPARPRAAGGRRRGRGGGGAGGGGGQGAVRCVPRQAARRSWRPGPQHGGKC